MSEPRTALQLIEERASSIESVLPPQLRPQIGRIVALARFAVVHNNKLMQCEPRTVLLAVAQSAQLGLDVGGASGHGYLVPFGRTAQFVPGYKGLAFLTWQADGISIDAEVVYSADTFRIQQGTDPQIVHEPNILGKRGAMIAAYAVGFLPDGRRKFVVLRKDEVDRIRQRSPRGKDPDSPWSRDYDEMAKKSAVKRLMKLLPITSPRTIKALEIDTRAEMGHVTPFSDAIDIPAEPVPEPRTPAQQRLDALADSQSDEMTQEEMDEIMAREARDAD